MHPEKPQDKPARKTGDKKLKKKEKHADWLPFSTDRKARSEKDKTNKPGAKTEISRQTSEGVETEG